MGVTIHIRGKLRRPADVEPLVAEVVDIAATLEWKHATVDDELRGVSVQPHAECDSLLLFFDREGVLRHPFGAHVFVKTQFAPVYVHVALVKLLKHLGKRYFAELEVTDEGGYWETGDKKELARRHGRAGRAIRRLERALEDEHAPHPEESAGDIERRIERCFAKMDREDEELSEEDLDRIRGPEPPHPEDMERWTIDEWVEHFEAHDLEKSPFLAAMQGRGLTEEALEAAARKANEEAERDERIAEKWIKRADEVDREIDEIRRDAGAPEPEEEPDQPDEEPERVDPTRRRERMFEECPPLREAVELNKEFWRRLTRRKTRAPALEYASALFMTAIVGLQTAYLMRGDDGHDRAVKARQRVAAERLRAVADVLRAFPKLGLAEMAGRAAKIAEGFRRLTR